MKRIIKKFRRKFFVPSEKLGRRIFLFHEEYGKFTESVSGFLMIVSGYFQFIASYTASTPTLVNGVNVNPFSMFDISLIVFVLSSLFFWLGGILWIVSKNAPLLVNISGYFVESGEISFVKIKNEEPTDLISVYAKVLNFYGSNPKFDYVRTMGSDTIIRCHENVLSGQTIDLPIVEARKNDLLIKISKKDYHLKTPNQETPEELHEKYNVVLEVCVQLNSEKKTRVVGKYYGLIKYDFYNGGIETPEGIFIENSVIWKSFYKINDKEYASLVNSRFSLF